MWALWQLQGLLRANPHTLRVWTDHEPLLRWLFDHEKLEVSDLKNGQTARWLLWVRSFDLELRHLPGRIMPADGGSRLVDRTDVGMRISRECSTKLEGAEGAAPSPTAAVAVSRDRIAFFNRPAWPTGDDEAAQVTDDSGRVVVRDEVEVEWRLWALHVHVGHAQSDALVALFNQRFCYVGDGGAAVVNRVAKSVPRACVGC